VRRGRKAPRETLTPPPQNAWAQILGQSGACGGHPGGSWTPDGRFVRSAEDLAAIPGRPRPWSAEASGAVRRRTIQGGGRCPQPGRGQRAAGVQAAAPRPPGPPRKAAAWAEHIKVSRYDGADRRVSESVGGNRRPRRVQEVRRRADAPHASNPRPGRGRQSATGGLPQAAEPGRGPGRDPAGDVAGVRAMRPCRAPPASVRPGPGRPKSGPFGARASARVKVCCRRRRRSSRSATWHRAPPAGRARAAHRP
jgi:hypothetical protein